MSISSSSVQKTRQSSPLVQNVPPMTMMKGPAHCCSHRGLCNVSNVGADEGALKSSSEARRSVSVESLGLTALTVQRPQDDIVDVLSGYRTSDLAVTGAPARRCCQKRWAHWRIQIICDSTYLVGHDGRQWGLSYLETVSDDEQGHPRLGGEGEDRRGALMSAVETGE